MPSSQAIAFAGARRIAKGLLADVAIAAKDALDHYEPAPVLVFDAVTSIPIDIDFRGDANDVRARLAVPDVEDAARGRGRPKLGVTAREVTLLPRHWDWLARQRGGASATLRRLVDEARAKAAVVDVVRQSREALYRFITAMAGDAPSYEEATRALFAGDEVRFERLITEWSPDIRDHAMDLAGPAFGHAPSPLDALAPGIKLAAVRRALTAAFADRPVERAEPLAGGASPAKLFRLTVDGKDYVLRIEGAPGGLRDPARQYACLKIAAEAGVAPPLLHADAEHGVAITAFAPTTPSVPPLSRTARLTAAAETVRRLHATPLFPRPVDYFDAVQGLLEQFRASGVLPEAVLSAPLAFYALIAAAYPRDEANIVSSHNDLNPSNMIFEGERMWIVDWETAFAADRYVDIAALTTFQTASEAEEELVLATYFGPTLDSRIRARFFLMQQVSRIFYAVLLLNTAAEQRLRLGADALSGPPLSAIRGEMATLVTHEGRIRFGCAFLAEAIRHLESPRLDAALALMEQADR
jgi:aminoglycoside phosphotransferase (APT) family kinase protein